MPTAQPPWVLVRRQAIGLRIRTAREHANLSQEALGQRVGVDNKTIHRIEHGTSDPSLGLLIQIADALNVPFSKLVE
jgi:transcriptional regulator with XRE-family HTH domain